MKTNPERVLTAACLVLAFATLIGFTDNYVRVIAAEGGLWQFHAIRTAMVFALLAVFTPILGLRLWPRSLKHVAGRSALHGVALLIYFGALAFLPVAQVAAGLFTAPIFVLLISRFVYGHPIGVVRIAAVATGFTGMFMVLGLEAVSGASPAALLPVVAGVFYAMGNIVTREWCADETPEALALGFFTAMGVLGVVGLVVLSIFPQSVPEGTAGFVMRGWVTPSPDFLWWTFVQAAGSLLAVAMLMRAYLIADASRVSVFEYLNLPLAAFWGWIIWDELLSPMAMLGMVLITAAGAMIALRARQAEVLPTA